MGVIARSFFPGKSCGLSKTLLVPAFDDLGDALVNLVATVFLKATQKHERLYIEAIMNEQRTFRLPWMYVSSGM